MKKYTVPIILAFTLSLFLILLMATTPSQALPNQPEGQPTIPTGTDIYTSRQMQEGIVSTSLQSIFGPNICTTFGDPFSPLNSIWAPGAYTYRYRIEIPADYPHNVLRVEIFDPDSINNANNTDSISRTNAAIQAGVSPITPGSCPYLYRSDACFIETGEAPNGNPIGSFEFDQINPLWYMRVDHNRGTPTPGQCGRPQTYTEAYNTATRFELSYYQDNGDGATQETPLASYTGQTGLEANNHETDLHWVSPGADISFGWDKDAPGIDVPADSGSQTANGFEIDLTTEVPNIVTDPNTGNRYIYIGVTALTGSSKNSFEFWAGPSNHVNNVPSNVNTRNLYTLNNPGSHSSNGVNIYALNYLPQQSNIEYRVEKPLINLTPEQGGESVFVTLFDADTRAESPITFYLDTIPKEDWSLTFGAGGIDSDGITSTIRCQITNHGCDNQWIDPPYEIKLPSGTKDCDFSNPNDNTCTPFYGGHLIAEHQGGRADTYGWQISVSQNETHDATAGCDAFPIAIHEGVRSVHDPTLGNADGNAYPAADDFTSPDNPRTYESFIHHVDNAPLDNATEGTVFKVQQGSGDGTFGWLVWNEGINPNSYTLGNSLTWPGDTHDYTNHGDGGQVLPGQDHVVRGYVEPSDSSDTELHLGDWIANSTGSINSGVTRSIFEEHISRGRVLRLPIWNNSQGSGSFGRYQTAVFALFRIHGYSLSQGNGGSWILLEFIRFDNSCGQPPPLLNNVTIDGLTRTAPNEAVTLTANITPVTATQPISYTWEATDFAPITQSNTVSDTISFNWATTGNKTITVTAQNIGNSVIGTHTVNVTNLLDGPDLTIIGTPQLVTPLPLEESDSVEFAVTVKNLGDTAVSAQSFINLYVNPIIIPATTSDGFNLLYDLDPGASKTIHITLANGLTIPDTPHQIYAMVDSDNEITEVDESNNISAPLSLDASNFAEKKFIYLPMIIKN